MPFPPLFCSISTAVSLRKCSNTLPGVIQKPPTNSYEDGLFEWFVVASIISFPYSYIQLFIALRSWEEGMLFQPSTLSLSSLLPLSCKGLSRPVPRLCLSVFLLGLIHKKALQPGQGPVPGRSRLFLIKPVCKYHLQFYSQQKLPVYCILASGFLKSLDLGKREQVCLLNEVCYAFPTILHLHPFLLIYL